MLTSVCLGRVPHFASFGAARAVCSVFVNRTSWGGSRPLAWVVMPDHWHALVELADDVSLAALVRGLNSRAARAANAANGRQGRVFCPAFHDRALRAEDDILHCARYIAMNPVRAGLARSVGDYPFWHSIHPP